MDANTELFLDYYFSGSDQELNDILMTLGEIVREQLYQTGTAKVDVQTLMEGADPHDFYDWVDQQRLM